MTVAVFLGAFDVTRGRTHPMRMAMQAAGLLSAVYAVMLIVGAAAGSVDPVRPLDGLAIASKAEVKSDPTEGMAAATSREDLARQFQIARSAGRPTLVYFTADWCVSCRSIDRAVLTKRDVVDALVPLQTLKVDLSDIGPTQRELMPDLDVVGPPTMIFFNPDQQEIKDGRLIGEFGVKDVFNAVRAARSGT